MAINYLARYPGQVDPATSDYPAGTPKNDVTPGDQSGTPWEAAHLKDVVGFGAALLQELGETASDTPETANASQYLGGVKAVVRKAGQITTADLIGANTSQYPVGHVLTSVGHTTGEDGGSAPWQKTALTGTPSQTPSLRGDATLTDADGNVWELAGYVKNSTQLGAEDLLEFNVFSKTDGNEHKTATQIKTQDSGSHIGESRYGVSIEHSPTGSGENGPASADYGLGVSVIKNTWPNADTSTAGEIDGLTISVRNTGPDADLGESSDASGILVNAQSTEKCGFIASAEFEASQIDKSTFGLVRRGKVQLVPLDRDEQHRVITVIPQVGNFDELMLFFDDGSVTYGSIIKAISGGVKKFEIDANGDIVLYRPDGVNAMKLKNLGPGLAITNDSDLVVLEVSQNLSKINLNYRSVSAVGHTITPTSFAPGPLEAGLSATDDGSNWSGVNPTGSPRPVFYDGTSWVAMT